MGREDATQSHKERAMSLRNAVIVAAVRTPIGRADKGALVKVRPEDLAATALRAAMARTPGLAMKDVEDVIFGCAMPEGVQGLNIARIAALHAGFPVEVPAATVNRFCSSGLQTVAQAAERIMVGAVDVMIAGGVESMSMVPMTGHKPSPHPKVVSDHPEVFMPMGNTAELLAEQYGITRLEQDTYAAESHRRAVAAQTAGHFDAELVPVEFVRNGERVVFAKDECPRADTTVEKLGTLKAVFKQGGTVTAGTASPKNDGAAAVVMMSEERAKALGLTPLAYYRGYQVAGVPPEIMGIGPVAAVPKLLAKAGVGLADIDQIELNEAFAVQALAVIRNLGLDTAKTNPLGGAIALGHPLGCSGARLVATLLHSLARTGGKRGIVTMCVGGGMGAAGLFERP